MVEHSNNQQLEAPGAGLPPAELFLVKSLFGAYCFLRSKQGVLNHFSRDADLLVTLMSSLDIENAKKRVLIKRVPGIEDSSRYWSVFMVLEHLSIVNNGILRIIKALTEEQIITEQVRIEDVKPQESAGTEQVAAFSHSVKSYVDQISGVSDLRSKTRHPHPWFGPLNAHGWHCLAAVHQTVHRYQISRILAVLPTNKADT